MYYVLKSVVLSVVFIYLSMMKGWMLFFLIFAAFPVLLIWLIVLGVVGRKNALLRNKVLIRTSYPALLLAFAIPGVGDTSDVSAFTVISAFDDSLITYIAYIVSLVAIIVFFIYAFKGLKDLISNKNNV